MAELRHIRLYRATTRPLLFLGAERELMLSLIIACTALVFVTVSIPSFIIGVLVWLFGTVTLRILAKVDPQMSKVFLRYWNQFRQPVFGATARPTSAGFRIAGPRR